MNASTLHQKLFPPLHDLEPVLWPGLALLVFVVSAVLVDLVIVMATRYRLVDLPNRRSAHALPTARGGGVAIVFTMAAAATLAAFRWPSMATQIMLGGLLPSLVIGFVGIIDDNTWRFTAILVDHAPVEPARHDRAITRRVEGTDAYGVGGAVGQA